MPSRTTATSLRLIVAAAALLAGGGARATNRLPNSGFELPASPAPNTLPAGWAAAGSGGTQVSFGISTADELDGAQSMYGEWTSTSGLTWISRRLQYPYVPAANVMASVHGACKRVQATAGGTYRVNFRIRQSTGASLTSVACTTAGDTDAAWRASPWSSAVQLTAGNSYLAEVEWYVFRFSWFGGGTTRFGAYADGVHLQISPASPTVAMVPDTTHAKLSWAATTAGYPGPRATDTYQVYRDTSSGVPLTCGANGVTCQLVGTNGWTDTSTTGNRRYYYRITDFDTAGDESPGSVEVSFLTPPAAPTGLVVLGSTATSVSLDWTPPPGDAPRYEVEYRQGATGAWTRATSNVTSSSYDVTGLFCEQPYDFRVRGANATGGGVWSSTVSRTTGTCPPYVEVGDGTNPSPVTLCPAPATPPADCVAGGTCGDVDAFTLKRGGGASSGTVVTNATVSFPAGTSFYASQVAIVSDDPTNGATRHAGPTNVTGDLMSLALSPALPTSTTATPYRVRVWSKPHAAYGAPPGSALHLVSTTVGPVVASPVPTDYYLRDTASGAVTIDNLSPSEASWTKVTSVGTTISLEWFAPSDGDVQQMFVLRDTAPITAPATIPAEGSAAPALNALLGTARVISSGNVAPGQGFTHSETATLGLDYYYKAYVRDACGNWSVGSQVGPVSPAENQVIPGTATATVNSCAQITVSAPFTGDQNGNSKTFFERGPTSGGPWTQLDANDGTPGVWDPVTGPSPRAYVDGGLTRETTYFYRVTFNDVDNPTQPAPLIVSRKTSACPAILRVEAGTMPGAAYPTPNPVIAGAMGAPIASLRLTTLDPNATIRVTALSLANAAPPPAVQTDPAVMQPNTDVKSLWLVDEATGEIVGNSLWDGARYLFPNLDVAVAGGSPRTIRVELNVLYGAAASSQFRASVDPQADVQVLFPDAVESGATVVGNLFRIVAPNGQPGYGATEGTTEAYTSKPTVTIMNPVDGAVVTQVVTRDAGGSVVPAKSGFRVQAHVFSPPGIASAAVNVTATPVKDDGTIDTGVGAKRVFAAAHKSSMNRPPYVPSPDAVLRTGLFEANLSGLTAGRTYLLRAEANNSATGGVPILSGPVFVRVNDARSTGGGQGDGMLLVRDNSNQLCSDCHAIKSHSAETVADPSQGYRSKYGSWSTNCRDCHTTHNTYNAYLVKNYITPPSVSGTYQNKRYVRFYDKATGDAGTAEAVSYVAGDPDLVSAGVIGPCQACHTRTTDGGGNKRWTNDAANQDITHFDARNGATQRCTDCHSHKEGFRARESAGGEDCETCHRPIVDAMAAGNGTHFHVMSSGKVAPPAANVWSEAAPTSPANDVYPTAVPGAADDARRTCLMCHADHDLFRAAGAGRGKNLRADISVDPKVTPSAISNTDFDPAQANGGLCVSCHKNAITKSVADPDGTTTTPAIAKATYDSSAHDYSASSTFRGADSNSFVANCSKCHNDTRPKQFQSSAWPNKFSLHDSSIRSILDPMGLWNPYPSNQNASDPLEETFCLQCHRKSTDAIAGAANKPADLRDQYNATAMSPGSQDIFAKMALFSGGSGTMSSNKLFFENAATDATFTVPKSPDVLADAQPQAARAMIPEAATKARAATSHATRTTANQIWSMVTFVSPPVAVAKAVPSGTWTLRLYARESNSAQDAQIRYFLYVHRVDGTVTTLAGPTTNTGEIVATGTAPGTQYTMSPSVASTVNLAVGDRIAVDFLLFTSSADTFNTYTSYFSYGASTEGSLQLPNAATVEFTYTPSAVSAMSGHDVAAYSGLHQRGEDQAHVSANKHVECADCHNPHAAGNLKHTPGGTTAAGGNLAGNDIGTRSPIYQVNGVQPTFGGTNWAVPTGYTALDCVPAANCASKEYQICFKCHSGANTNVLAWGGKMPSNAAVDDWTNLAQEFNPANASFHPVVAANTTYPLRAAQLRAPWSPGMRMTCSDCHGNADASSAAAQGPHGSAVSYMLRGAKTLWPPAARLSADADFQPAYDSSFCSNCHVNSNTVHNEHRDRGAYCYSCHILVPHGGKLRRLIGDGDSASFPARYAYQGNKANMLVRGYNGGSSRSNCGTSCGGHSNSGPSGGNW